MSHITTCPRCGACYEESSEEHANDPRRLCPDCCDIVADEPNDRGDRERQLRIENQAACDRYVDALRRGAYAVRS